MITSEPRRAIFLRSFFMKIFGSGTCSIKSMSRISSNHPTFSGKRGGGAEGLCPFRFCFSARAIAVTWQSFRFNCAATSRRAPNCRTYRPGAHASTAKVCGVGQGSLPPRSTRSDPFCSSFVSILHSAAKIRPELTKAFSPSPAIKAGAFEKGGMARRSRGGRTGYAQQSWACLREILPIYSARAMCPTAD
jgi:hypothetical protein